jgi:D-alanine-D-alanine ligase
VTVLNIVVLAGGLSTERDVSLSTGSMVCRALRELGHRALLLDVYLGLEFKGPPAGLFKGPESTDEILKIPDAGPDLAAVRALRKDGSASFFGPGVLGICNAADMVFIALHGICGEDGRLQAALELSGIPYTGTGSLGSALAMNKDMAKRLLSFAGVPTARWACAGPGDDPAAAAAGIGLPCVVKPLSGGSSIGVFIPETAQALKESLDEALKYDEAVMIEEYIKGREFSVGILGGEALPVIEIIPHEGFYDYKNKYQTGFTDEICPARLTEEQTLEVQRLALRAHGALMLGSYSRIDFILDESGGFVCLEANTLPGMTPTSLLPQEAKAAGISYNELCRRLVAAAQNRKLL